MIELDPDGRLLKIIVRTRRRGEQMSNLCWLVFSAIDSLVKEWYNLKVRRRFLPISGNNNVENCALQTQVYVPCPHCMSLGTKSAPHLFPLKECQMAAVTLNNAFLSCPHIGAPLDSNTTSLLLITSFSCGRQTGAARQCGSRFSDGTSRQA